MGWPYRCLYERSRGRFDSCVDYQELNKKIVKDAFPLPRQDEVWWCLAGSSIFSTLDFHSGYWHPEDWPKTAFSPGPGMGLFQFNCMPFGLTVAPSSFQWLMDTVLRGLPFVTTYLDDGLVHSAMAHEHAQHLNEFFRRVRETGLTLRESASWVCQRWCTWVTCFHRLAWPQTSKRCLQFLTGQIHLNWVTCEASTA